MQRAVQRIRRKLPRKVHEDLSNLNNFSVRNDVEEITASDFIKNIRKENRPEMTEIDNNELPSINNKTKPLDPSNYRPKGQTGLDEFRKS